MSQNQSVQLDSQATDESATQVLLDVTIDPDASSELQSLEPQAPETDEPQQSFLRLVGFWVVTLYLLYQAILNVPSISSLALLVAAALVCPADAVRNLGFMRRLHDVLPGLSQTLSGQLSRTPVASHITPGATLGTIASTLAVLGLLTTPTGGQLALRTYLDFQDVQVSAPDFIEYSQDPIALTDVITCSNPEVSVASSDGVVASAVGVQEVLVDLSEGAYHRSENLAVTVQDTQPPTVKLQMKQVSVGWRDKFDPLKNVVSVTDPVDGALQNVDEQPDTRGSAVGLEQFYDEGWYVVSGEVDTETPGKYTVTIDASDQHGNEVESSYDVLVLDPLAGVELEATTSVLEYSNKSVDPLTLVTCNDPETMITCTALDLRTVGTQTVVYTLEKGPSTLDKIATFEVRDTKGPEIALAQSEVTITEGDAFDPYACVSSVSDPVDGALARVDTEPAEAGDGWFTITGTYDPNKEGLYFLRVVACDRNGNQETTAIRLEVNEPPLPVQSEPTAESTQTRSVDTAKDYVLNTNTMKFHRPNCRYVETIYDHNRQDVHKNRQEVIDSGYAPCKVCKP